MRICYMRDPDTMQSKPDGTCTRGTPVAVVITSINKEENYISYAYAAVHPNDVFVKTRARHIAEQRLNGVDTRGKRKCDRKRGGRMIPGIPFHNHALNSHEITKLVMRDLCASQDAPERLRALAGDWLAKAAEPKVSRPAIPPPPMNTSPEPKVRNIVSPREFADRAAQEYREQTKKA